MDDLRNKVRLNKGELPTPNHAGSALEPGVNCASYADGAERRRTATASSTCCDYACDSRVDRRTRRTASAPTDLLDPQDLHHRLRRRHRRGRQRLRRRHRGLGLPRQRQRPFDDVQYGHGTGEAEDSSAEANNGGQPGTCPNCMVIPLRVGDSFVADVNNFAQAVLYAVDNGVLVDPGGARHAQPLDARARGGRLRLRARRRGDRLGRRRGGAAPQLAVELPAHDRRQLGQRSTRRRSRRPPTLLPPVQRLHELLVARSRSRSRARAARRTRPASAPAWPGLIYSAALERARGVGEPARRRRRSCQPRRRQRVRDHRQRGAPADGGGHGRRTPQADDINFASGNGGS